MHYPGAGRHNSKVIKGFLSPSEELISLTISLKFKFNVLIESVFRSEVIDLDYFGADALPNPLLEWHRQRIFDALNGAVGVARLQDTVWPFERDLSRRELYALRDRSGQTRQQVFLQFLQGYDPALDILETGSDGNS